MKPGYGAASEAMDMEGFGHGDHLLVRSWRRIAAGRVHCPVMIREFTETFGEDGPEVFLTFCIFMKALAFSNRRPLTVGGPGSPAVTAGERQVLSLLAAAQTGTSALFDAHLRWLSRPEQRHILRIAAGALAKAFTMNGLLLALPDTDAPPVFARALALA